jgi:hypothetical protein
VTPDPIPAEFPDAVMEPFWGDAFGDMGWFEHISPDDDPFSRV